MKRVLFVDDEPLVLEALRDALRPRRREWHMTFAPGGAAAAAALAAEPFDVVVSDMRMPGMDGAAVLELARGLQPTSVRIVLSGFAEADKVARAASAAHRFLAKPCSTEDLMRVVERSLALAALTEQGPLLRAAMSAGRLPCVPAAYTELLALLGDPGATLADAGQIVARDVAMAAKVLQLANSAFFGRTGATSSLERAVAVLGLRTLTALALSAGALAAFTPAEPIEGFSIADVQRHGALVSRVAQGIVGNGPDRDEVTAAALLHDVGLLVLATEAPDYLAGALATARQEQRPVAEVEAAHGTTHADVGAQLLNLWGLPHPVVEAVAFHHTPDRHEADRLDATVAVWLADTLVAELADGGPPVDPERLASLGLSDRLDGWRDLARQEVARD